MYHVNDDENFEKSFETIFLEREKITALNQEKFTLATDDTIDHRRIAKWCKRYLHQQKYVVLVKCVEDVVRRKEYIFGNRGVRSPLSKMC